MRPKIEAPPNVYDNNITIDGLLPKCVRFGMYLALSGSLSRLRLIFASRGMPTPRRSGWAPIVWALSTSGVANIGPNRRVAPDFLSAYGNMAVARPRGRRASPNRAPPDYLTGSIAQLGEESNACRRGIDVLVRVTHAHMHMSRWVTTAKI